MSLEKNEKESKEKRENYISNQIDIYHIAQILYAEAANQSEKGRKLIGEGYSQ